MAYSTTTSSSNPTSSTTLFAIQGLITCRFTFRMSTYRYVLIWALNRILLDTYLFLEFRGKFQCFKQFQLLVRKSSVLATTSTWNWEPHSQRLIHLRHPGNICAPGIEKGTVKRVVLRLSLAEEKNDLVLFIRDETLIRLNYERR